MKRSFRAVLSFVVAVIMISAISIPVFATEFDFDTAIAAFKSDSENTFALEVNENVDLKRVNSRSPSIIYQIDNQQDIMYYSSNESVVTVSKDGIVTAVGEGTAYVAADAGGSNSRLYCFNVYAKGKPRFDFDAAIAEFKSDSENTFALEVNENVDLQRVNSVFIKLPIESQKDIMYYSSNESVVTVSKDGIVTAVGEGTAYVAVDEGGTQKLYCFNVYAKGKPRFDFDAAIAEFKSDSENTFALEVNKNKHLPYIGIIVEYPHVIRYYSSDESVVTVSQSGTVTAVGEGTAYVAVDKGGTQQLYCFNVSAKSNVKGSMEESWRQVQQRIEEDERKDNLRTLFSRAKRFLIIAPILTLVISFLIYRIATTLYLSVTSIKKKGLPVKRQTANTITTVTADRQTYVLPIRRIMTAKKAEALINEWFAENPYVYDCKLKLKTFSSLLSPFVYLKFFVTNAAIEYSVADTVQPQQYGMAFIYKFRLFGPIGYNGEKLVGEWQANNTDCQVLSTQGSRIQHIGTHGFWAQYYNFVFFKKQ